MCLSSRIPMSASEIREKIIRFLFKNKGVVFATKNCTIIFDLSILIYARRIGPERKVPLLIVVLMSAEFALR